MAATFFFYVDGIDEGASQHVEGSPTTRVRRDNNLVCTKANAPYDTRIMTKINVVIKLDQLNTVSREED